MTIYDRYIRALARYHGGKRPESWIKQKFGSLFLRFGPGMLTCRQFDQFLFSYLEGELSAGQRARFEGHMVLCPMCRAHFESYLAVYKLAGAAFGPREGPVPESVPEELIEAVLDVAAKPGDNPDQES